MSELRTYAHQYPIILELKLATAIVYNHFRLHSDMYNNK